jgi:hypothetical protein
MLVIHGIYHWRPKRIAFRNDYCRACKAQTVSVLIRTLDVLHLFWIPILPLGAWSRWFCMRCNSRPHHAVVTRRGFKIAGAGALALMTLGVWVPLPPDADGMWIIWLLRFGLLVALAFTIRSIFTHRPEAKLRELLATVPPFEGRSCPLCGGELLGTPDLVCLTCGAAHRPLVGTTKVG